MNLKLLLILLFALCGPSVTDCAKRYASHYEYKEKIYYFETFYKATWFKAFMACSKMGMELLSIDSDEEFDKIHEIVKDKFEYKPELSIWTSGAMKEIGQFGWINTGNPVNVSKWWSNTPDNNGGNEFCIHIWFNSKLFLLNDIRCTFLSYYICQSRKD
ncbi:PREDICTED: C-type lectin 37Db-like [Nicrophorus vespilloides]|uniref:C-type lectin 37Db-like n=1 Tax=Nicrophorus vespilloides TaxID=110193 RepID=A0ABM1MSG7_NICVS|nr:PREDICTED: C-type lectin 37Db-like [Nicrophorus vespilloides]